jgi:2-polyprenyl-6-methoxyphenol hydroxylase-like FAD-dependent oxidoreductase
MGRRMQEQDTYFFQGGDQAASSFMFFAVQDTPFHNDREDQDTYACQLIVSWPYRAGFLGRDEPIEVPESQEGRLELMKEIANSWATPFRDAVFAVPEDTHIQHVHLESWKPELGAWDNLDGRATLIGDSAHTMTMFRGEAFNHGIVDVQSYVSNHLPVLTGEKDIATSVDACAAYEREMVDRTRLAVGASSEACLDAHSFNHERITEGSPLVSKRMGRAVVATSA